MTDTLRRWIWNVPSVDEYWNEKMRHEHEPIQKEIISKLPDGYLKDYLTLKMQRNAWGKAIVICSCNGKKIMYYDVRDFETYVRVKKLNNTP